MSSFMRSRLARVTMLVALAGLGVTGLAYATAPSDQGPFPLTSVPDCLATVPAPPGGAHLCKVHPFAGPTVPWQASTGEWIVIRAGFYYPDPSAQAECQADQASVVATITIDGKNVPVDTIPCTVGTGPYTGYWPLDYRALSHPLTPGVHNIVETLTWTTTTASEPAGFTYTLPATLTVVNGAGK